MFVTSVEDRVYRVRARLFGAQTRPRRLALLGAALLMLQVVCCCCPIPLQVAQGAAAMLGR